MKDADGRTLAARVALACNILADQGQGDVTLGHVSARLPGGERMLMKASGLGLEEVSPDDILELDWDGRVWGGSGRRHSEYPIHSETYRQHPNVGCVVHTHPLNAIALVARGETIRAVCHEGVLFHGAPVFSETTALIREPAEGRSLARTLGDHRAVLMRNHGVLVAGETVEEATVRAVLLEKAAAIQLRAGQETNLSWSTDDEIELKVKQIYNSSNIEGFFAYYARRLQTSPPPALGNDAVGS